MSRLTAVWRIAASTLLCISLTLAIAQPLSAKEKPPQVTEDGLELKKQTKQRLVYMRPGASFAQYNRVTIVDPLVEFSKTWQRDYNSKERDPSRRVSDKDIEKAKTFLSEQFRKIFTEELGKAGYEVTDAPGQDVLVLRPALVDIQVSAPDLMAPGRSSVYAESSGEMTLYLELWDRGTDTILARVADAQGDPDFYGQRQTSVSNKAAADRILTSWAQELCKKLDLARGKSEPE